MLNTSTNILKLLNYFKISKDELAAYCEISRAGFYKGLKSGSFRMDTLERISEFFKVPTIILLADELAISEQISTSDGWSVIIRWQAKDVLGVKTTIKGHDVWLGVVYSHKEKRQQEDDEIELANLRQELAEKKSWIKMLESNLDMANKVVLMATKASDSRENYIGQLEYLITQITGTEFPKAEFQESFNDKLSEITLKFISDITEKNKNKGK